VRTTDRDPVARSLRISEALTLTETDLDPKPGSVLVRAGKGGKRRTVGMDHWAWEHVARWTDHRVSLPIGPLFCIPASATETVPSPHCCF
jgi:integrase